MATKWNNLTPEERQAFKERAQLGDFGDQLFDKIVDTANSARDTIVNGVGIMSAQIKTLAEREINSRGFEAAKERAENAKAELDAVLDKSEANPDFLMKSLEYVVSVAGLNAYYDQESKYNDNYKDHAVNPMDIAGLKTEAMKKLLLISDRLEKSAVGEASLLRRIDQLEGIVFGHQNLFAAGHQADVSLESNEDNLRFIDQILNGNGSFRGINDILKEINEYTEQVKGICEKIYAETSNQLNHNALSGSKNIPWELTNVLASLTYRKNEMLDKVTALLVSIRTQMFEQGDYILKTPDGQIIDPKAAGDIRSITNHLIAEGGGLLSDTSTLELIRVDSLSLDDMFIVNTLRGINSQAKEITETAKHLEDIEPSTACDTTQKIDQCRNALAGEIRQSNSLLGHVRGFVTQKAAELEQISKNNKELAENKKEVIRILGTDSKTGSLAEYREKQSITMDRLDSIKLAKTRKELAAQADFSVRYDEWIKDNMPRGLFATAAAKEEFVERNSFESFKQQDRIYLADMTKIDKDYKSAFETLRSDMEIAQKRFEHDLQYVEKILADPQIAETEFGKKYTDILESITVAAPFVPAADERIHNETSDISANIKETFKEKMARNYDEER